MIGSYRFGSVTIHGIVYHNDVIVYPDRVEPHWWRKEGHRLCIEDIQEVLREHLDTLVVGTGYFGRMQIKPEVADTLGKRGITLIARKTAEACDEYNRLKDSRKVVAALHLTC
jgi:hypothetical protein